MATKLKNLKIRKVDFVDEGANPDAHIGMFKRKVGEGKEAEEGDAKGSGGILKRLLGFIGKAAGMDQGEIDLAMDAIQNGDSVSFNEKMDEYNNRKIADEIWDICFALESSLCSILNDGEMDSAGAQTAMLESLEEFHAVAQAAIPKWAKGKAASIIRKNEGLSAPELEIMKGAVERLNSSIEKAGKGEKDPKAGGETEGKESGDHDKEGDEEEMKIDKSKLTDAERSFLESIEKRCGTEDGASVQDGGTGAPAPAGQMPPHTEQTPPSVPADAGVSKSAAQSAEEPEPGSRAEESDGIYKGLHPAVRAELEGLKKFREEAEERELTEVAKRYAIIGKKEEELVPLFKSLRAAGGTAYQDMIAVLDQAVATVEKSGVFSEIGKPGHGGAEGGAWAEADVKATELMKSKTGLSKAQAFDEVFMADPELAARCEKED